MGGLLAKLAEFIGRVLAMLIPALGKEIRKNKVVKQTGADYETLETLNDSVWDAANSERVQQSLHPENRPAPGRTDPDHQDGG